MSNNTASKTLIFNFDGTSSEPRDSRQYSSEHFKEDMGITNVLKLHLMLGGKLHSHAPPVTEQQQCFYYCGIGDQGGEVKKLLNQILAPNDKEVATILTKAISDFNYHFQPGDKILLIGFSRGAALARRFAKCLERYISQDVYLCVFDTIASIGFSKITKATCGTEHVIFEDHNAASNVAQALHCVSLDDKRRAFEPTLFNYAQHIKEVWFAGCHSDIGGGFYRSGLSDITLRYAIEWLINLDIGLKIYNKEHINFQALLPYESTPLICEEDVTLCPDVLARSYQHDYFWLNSSFKVINRQCTVLEYDQVSQRPPIIHHSVAQRINSLSSYRPESLKSVTHIIEDNNNNHLTCVGLPPHLALTNQHITILQTGEKVTVKVFASQKYNTTGVMLEKGATYRFSTQEEAIWYDNGHPTNIKGWNRAKQTIGVKRHAIELFLPYKRATNAQWFALIGCIEHNDDTAFLITNTCEVRINHSGEFTPFANDINKDYQQNSGSIDLTITRLG
ncbi:hypothetical protein PCIT_b0118 [Pseudoalteromonas citrea]|uniref:T6SS Phospholipase effector Tle1-like catalytic domain-containing protein n=2 Tax=Pseudoalteromonas citrea TaxID=43655 RepID=A0AAD4FPN9_9GAMM|nr:DUF2235 domain-containing protein [Pseudoalteromonas citrea]KAF7764192.1 hypothetical protein PCIT_b0118 [Pseudoalteromonas citrea]